MNLMKLINIFIFSICIAMCNNLDARSSKDNREKISKKERREKRKRSRTQKNSIIDQNTESSQHHASMNHAMPAEFESNKKNGNWNDSKTWNKNAIPAACCSVVIKQNQTVNISGDVKVKHITVQGSLIFSNRFDTNLEVQTIIIEKGGSLEIGSEKKTFPKKRNVSISFIALDKFDTKSEMFTHQLGLINHGGKLILNGKKITRIAEIESINNQRVKFTERVRGWNSDDELLFPATRFLRNETLSNDIRSIETIDKDTVNLKNSLGNKNLPNRHKTLVGNLSSNITIQSRSNNINERGHVMIMATDNTNAPCGENIISGVTFKNLGRTNKQEITSVTNQKMMYPLHFHHCGHTKNYTVKNNVIWGSPGWSYVNHRSNVSFIDNIAFEFKGAGFVTEFGDERGTIKGNLASGGQGLSDKKNNIIYPYRRLYITKGAKARLEKADLGFHGDGFWMTSPFVDVENNIAAGNHGSGFTWYLLGVDDLIKKDVANGKAVLGSHTLKQMPLAAQKKLGNIKPKRWYKAYGSNHYIHQDLPLFGDIKDNLAYANHVGIRIRYVASINLVAASHFLGIKGNEIVKKHIDGENEAKKVHIYPSQIKTSTLLNNEIGLHSTYSSNITYDGLQISSNQYNLQREYDNGKNYMLNDAPTGIELNHTSNKNHIIKDLEVSGYPICMRVSKKLVTYKRDKLKDCSNQYREFELDQNKVRNIRK